MMMMGKGVVVAASLWGKLKAVTYAVSGVLGVLYVGFERIGAFSDILGPLRLSLIVVFYLSAFSAVASFLVYLKGSIKR
jgi:CDP-diacylglycerol--glycerol-3-phosphate 3-phosphatidyltransferase